MSNPNARTGPKPTLGRDIIANVAVTDAHTSDDVRPWSKWATTNDSAATDQAIPHNIASWCTMACEPRNRAVDPQPVRNTKLPAASSVRQPTGPGPRTTVRACHAVRPANANKTAKANSIETRLRRPSKASVKATTGIRNTAGQGPKYA